MLLNFNPLALLRGFKTSQTVDEVVNNLKAEYPFESREYVEHLVISGNLHGVA